MGYLPPSLPSLPSFIPPSFLPPQSLPLRTLPSSLKVNCLLVEERPCARRQAEDVFVRVRVRPSIPLVRVCPRRFVSVRIDLRVAAPRRGPRGVNIICQGLVWMGET